VELIVTGIKQALAQRYRPTGATGCHARSSRRTQLSCVDHQWKALQLRSVDSMLRWILACSTGRCNSLVLCSRLLFYFFKGLRCFVNFEYVMMMITIGPMQHAASARMMR